jgi:hypothetical protein
MNVFESLYFKKKRKAKKTSHFPLTRFQPSPIHLSLSFSSPTAQTPPPAGPASLLPAQSASSSLSHLQVGPTCRDLLQPPAHACVAARGPAPSSVATRGPPSKLGPHAENLRCPRRTRTKPVSPPFCARAGLGLKPSPGTVRLPARP